MPHPRLARHSFFLFLAALASLFLHMPCRTTAALQYGYNHAPVQPDEDWVQDNFFPDLGWDLRAPPFISGPDDPEGWRNGTTGPTSEATLIAFLKDFATRNEYAQYYEVEERTAEGRVIPYIYMTNGEPHANKVRVWFQGAHGNEAAGESGLLAFIGELDTNPERAFRLLERLDILIIHRYNSDGVHYYQRFLANNLDPNRDHVKVTVSQTRAIKAILNEFEPHVAVDMHDFSAGRRWLDGRYGHASDILLAGAKNLNIDERIRNLTEHLVIAHLHAELARAGFRSADYVTPGKPTADPSSDIRLLEAGADAMLGRNAVGLTQAVSILAESRGINVVDQHFARRVAGCRCVVNAVLDVAWAHADVISDAVHGAVRRLVESGQDDVHIVVTSSARRGRRTYPLIDYENRTLVERDVEFAFTTPVVANLTRPRPWAYLIPAPYKDIADRLRALGLSVQTLGQPWTGRVEALRIASHSISPRYFEGVWRNTVTTTGRPYVRLLEAPGGSFVVRTDQRRAALAFVALEPESADGFVRFNLLPVIRGDEYPIFRVMQEEEGLIGLGAEYDDSVGQEWQVVFKSRS